MGQDPPRMHISYQQKFIYTLAFKVGDWFLFKRYIVIKIYGCEIEPYQLPVYIPPRLFSLEYCRQRLATDQLHFISKSKRASFSLPAEFSSFIIKNNNY
jgi:hypothetical protein